jgi:hypothetical protein
MGFGYAGGGVTQHTALTDKEVAGIIDHSDLSVISSKLRQSKDVWRTLQSAPYNFTTGCCAIYVGADYIYAFAVNPGTGNTVFLRYTLSTNSWSALTAPPSNIGAGAALCYTGGDTIYALKGGLTSTFWLYIISTDTWGTLNGFPSLVGAGGALVYTGDDYIYGLRGNGTTTFARFSLSGGSWTSMAVTNGNISSGGALSYPGGRYIYALRGGGTPAVDKYDILLNSWTNVTNIPQLVGDGGSLIYAYGSYIYAFCGNNSLYFYRLNISTPTVAWVRLANPPSNIGSGGSLVYANENFIYALAGGVTPNFYRYDGASEQKFGMPFGSHIDLKVKEVATVIDHADLSVSSIKLRQSKNVWQAILASCPSLTAIASALVYTGGNYIFAVIAGTNYIMRYSLSDNTWAIRATTPGGLAFGAGASLCYDGGWVIFAFRGGGTTDFWAYAIDSNTWGAMQSAPAAVGDGAGLAWTGSHIYAQRGNGTTDFWRYNLPLDRWEIMTSTPFAIGGSGGALVYSHGAQMYSLQGGAPTRFFIYNITENIWAVIATPPVNAGLGCSLVYTYGNYIYALMGGTTTAFYRYSLLTNEWNIMSSTPSTTGAGAALCYANEDFIYALRGGNTATFWRYDGGSEQRFRLVPHGQVHRYQGEDSIQEISALNTKWQREEWRSFIGSPVLSDWRDILDISGSGVIQSGTAYSSIYTAATANSYVVLGLYPLNVPDGVHFTEYLDFDKKIVIAAIVKILARSDAGVATFRIQDGNNHTNILTSRGFGFRFVKSGGVWLLQGMWHNGANLYTVELVSGFTLDTWYYLRAEFRTRKVTTASGVASVDCIDFYVNNVLLGTATANLPSGVIANAAELLHTIHNGADAVNNEMVISSSWDTFFYQHP